MSKTNKTFNSYHKKLLNPGTFCWINSCIQLFSDLVYEYNHGEKQDQLVHPKFFANCFGSKIYEYIPAICNPDVFINEKYKEKYSNRINLEKSFNCQVLLQTLFTIINPSTLKETVDLLLINLEKSFNQLNKDIKLNQQNDVIEAITAINEAIDSTPFHQNNKWYEMDFGFMYKDYSTILTKDKKHISTKVYNHHNIISLKLEKELPDIQAYINEYFKKELIDDFNGLPAEKQTVIKILPMTQFVIIQLGRFSRNLETSKLLYPIKPNPIVYIDCVKFKLIGVIIHHNNTISSGHYTYVSFSRDEECIPILNCNDSSITVIENEKQIIELNNIIKQNGYVFLYLRI